MRGLPTLQFDRDFRDRCQKAKERAQKLYFKAVEGEACLFCWESHSYLNCPLGPLTQRDIAAYGRRYDPMQVKVLLAIQVLEGRVCEMVSCCAILLYTASRVDFIYGNGQVLPQPVQEVVDPLFQI